MNVHIIFAHPSHKSSTYAVLCSFIQGLKDAQIPFTISDLYKLDFKDELDESQYLREMGLEESDIPEDVLKEQEKINNSDIVVFIYPLWWSDCPAKLKGWFDRVWSIGFARCYDENKNRFSRIIPKCAVAIVLAGNTSQILLDTKITDSLHAVMVEDRLKNSGFTNVHMEILAGMSYLQAQKLLDEHCKRAYELAKALNELTIG